jgi:hypothetical protein
MNRGTPKQGISEWFLLAVLLVLGASIIILHILRHQ